MINNEEAANTSIQKDQKKWCHTHTKTKTKHTQNIMSIKNNN